MDAVIYLLLGLAVIGAMAYALWQVNARQQRLNAELTRLERLTAEVAMSAEAVLEQVDQRIDRLTKLAADVEARIERLSVQQVATDQKAEPGVDPTPKKEPVRSRVRAGGKPGGPVPRAADQNAERKTVSQPASASVPEHTLEPTPLPIETAEPATSKSPADRYSHLRQGVYQLADQGKSLPEIAEALSIPRGEVQLMLNLRNRKVSHS